MGTRLGTIGAALVLALAAGGAQAAPAGAGASGHVVSVQAVPPAQATAPSAVPVAGAATASPAPSRTPRAHSAAVHAATIAGFAFHPGSITVTVGDTISWTNDDSAPHTATADDGSFDTGQLAKGASGSHTFTSPGTFAYHCTIHPSMHGTVTVVAAAGGTSTPPASTSTPTTPSTSAPDSSTAPARATLPRTGWNPAGAAVLGAGLLLAGCALRLSTRS
jgi:plastocyanin